MSPQLVEASDGESRLSKGFERVWLASLAIPLAAELAWFVIIKLSPLGQEDNLAQATERVFLCAAAVWYFLPFVVAAGAILLSILGRLSRRH